MQIRHILIKDHILIVYPETTELIQAKFGCDSPYVAPFETCVRQPHPPEAGDTKNRNLFNCPIALL